MVSFLKGSAPIMAVEMARRAAPGHVRPTFQELEGACRNKGTDAAAPEAPSENQPETPAADVATASS